MHPLYEKDTCRAATHPRLRRLVGPGRSSGNSAHEIVSDTAPLWPYESPWHLPNTMAKHLALTLAASHQKDIPLQQEANVAT